MSPSKNDPEKLVRRALETPMDRPPDDVVARAKAIFCQAAGRAQPAWLERIDAVIARLLHDSRLTPALAGFRGGSESFQAAWETDDAEIEIEGSVVALPARPGGPRRWQITGQVSPNAPASEIRVALARAGTNDAVAMAEADDSGMFAFEAPADSYDLMVRLDARAVIVTDVELC